MTPNTSKELMLQTGNKNGCVNSWVVLIKPVVHLFGVILVVQMILKNSEYDICEHSGWVGVIDPVIKACHFGVVANVLVNEVTSCYSVVVNSCPNDVPLSLGYHSDAFFVVSKVWKSYEIVARVWVIQLLLDEHYIHVIVITIKYRGLFYNWLKLSQNIRRDIISGFDKLFFKYRRRFYICRGLIRIKEH